MKQTLGDVLARHEQEVLDHLDRASTVPVVTFGRQGDVIVIPDELRDTTTDVEARPLPVEGVPVVRGENGGNTHLLVADGETWYAPVDPIGAILTPLALGTLVVAEGSTAYLIHAEHGAIGFPAGRYVISRQREFDGETQRIVAD